MRERKDENTVAMTVYLGLLSGLVGGLVWFALDTLSKGVTLGTAVFSDMQVKLSFLFIPIFFYSLVGLGLGILLSLLQLVLARGGKSVVFSMLPPYLVLCMAWTVLLLLCGVAAWERNNLKIGGPDGPYHLAALVGLSFLPIFIALVIGWFAWRRQASRIAVLIVFSLPLLLSAHALLLDGDSDRFVFDDAGKTVPSETGEGSINVLLITIDTLRRDHLGCYGNRGVKTPRIDELAKRGVLFDRCVAQAPITLPSHSSILTGTFPIYHGVHDNGYYRLDGDALSLSEVLGEAGYATSAFVSAFPLDAGFGLDQGFDHYDDRLIDRDAFFFSRFADAYALSRLMELLGLYRPVIIAERKAAETTEKVLTWLDSVGDRPFFLWVHLFDPHNPLNPPAYYEAMYADEKLLERVGSQERRDLIRSTRDFREYAPDSPEVAYMKALYKAEVSYTDYHVGRIVDRVDLLGLSDRTLIVFTADHGQSLFEHDYIGHSAALWGETINVPLIMVHPTLLPSGVKISALVQSVDLVPTILDILDFPPLSEVQGVSLLDLVRSNDPNAFKPVAYFETLHSTYAEKRFRGVVIGGWKLIRSEDGSMKKLYHLSKDPGELNDLSGTETERLKALEKVLNRMVVESGKSKDEERIEVDSQTRDILRSLGYVW